MPGLARSAARGSGELPPRWRIDCGDYVVAAGLAARGDLCVVGTGDGVVRRIELATGREAFRRDAHAGGVLGVAVAPDGTRFVSGGQDATAKLWDAEGQLQRELPADGAAWVEHVAWSPRGDRFATAAGRRVRVWTADGTLAFEAEPLPSTVSGLAWRADGTGLAAIAYGGVQVWSFAPRSKHRYLPWKGSLVSIAWSPDGKVIACGSQDCSVHFWRMATGEDSQMMGYPTKLKALAWDAESRLLATSGDAAITVWDFRGKGPEGTTPRQLEAHAGVCTQLAFDAGKGVLASGSQDSSVVLWEPRRSTRPLCYAFLDAAITALVWHPEHRALLGGDAHGNLARWEAP